MSKLSEAEVSEYLAKHSHFLESWLSVNGTTEHLQSMTKNLDYDGDVVKPWLSSFSHHVKNSITGPIFQQYVEGARSRSNSLKRDRSVLSNMSEDDIFMELIRDIASELDVNILCHKILQNVSILTNSDRGSLFLVKGPKEHRILTSKLFDVTETSTVAESTHTEDNGITVPFGKGIAGHVALTKETVNIVNAYQDPRFNQEVDKRTGYKTISILCLPIINYDGVVIGVAQIINKKDGNHEFTKQDEETFRKYLTFCGIGITNAELFEMSVNEFRRNKLLLHLARGIFEEQTNLKQLIKKIMIDAQDLLKCERCSVYLLQDGLENDIHKFTKLFIDRIGNYSNKSLILAMQDPSNASKSQLPEKEKPKIKNRQDVVFSMAFYINANNKDCVIEPTGLEIADSKTAEIAKYVIIKGTSVTIGDVMTNKEGDFGKGPFTEADGFVTHSILCMPVFNSNKKIIGVTQLMNKLNGEPFDENDENIIEAFSIFTGLGIHNCQMYENACRLMAKQTVALEVLSYHATAQKDETDKLVQCKIPSSEMMRLYKFDFDDTHLGDHDTLKAVIRMFTESNTIKTFKIPYDVMCRWTCSVRKNYRPVTYHNWRHAFNVCQTMFTMLFTGDMRPKFEDLEVFALMVACLCHDLDHRGTNNDFQVKVASPLAMLYSTSTLEHHHFDHSIMILNSEGNNIFQSLSPTEYRRAIKILEHAILSTDLALYFEKRNDFTMMVNQGDLNFDTPFKKDILKAMMMTACDVAAISKPWEIQQTIAQLVAGEFFEQGDIEKSKLGKKPIPMMDREKKGDLPKMQVGFIDAVCLPVYLMFTKMSNKMEPLLSGCQSNRTHWLDMTGVVDDTLMSNERGPATASGGIESQNANRRVLVTSKVETVQVTIKRNVSPKPPTTSR